MAAKFVIGLTDLESDVFYPAHGVAESYDGPVEQFEKNVYILQRNDTSIEKASIEWELDTTLPAVNNLLNVLSIMKSKLYITQVYAHKYHQVLPGLYDTDFVVELKNLIPNVGLVLPEYTTVDYENISTNTIPTYCSLELDSSFSYMCANNIEEDETLFYSMANENYDFLKTGPLSRFVYPAFRINFRTNSSVVINKEMTVAQKEWMTANKEMLESKGYYITDPKSKIGALVIGQLIGSYDDAFNKAQQYNKICRVEIVEE